LRGEKKMKSLIKGQALILLMVASLFVASCGKDNTTSNVNTSNTGFGGTIQGQGGQANWAGGSTGSPTLDSIIQQSTCQGSMGPNAYSLLAVTNQGGTTTAFQPNYTDITNVYVGRNLYGDVVVLRSMGGYDEMIIKVCSRSFLTGQGIQMGLQTAGDFVVNVSNQCSVNEVTSGTAVVRFTNPQGGTYDLPILPSALYLHTPLASVCSGY
jgi:hypothetical protein